MKIQSLIVSDLGRNLSSVMEAADAGVVSLTDKENSRPETSEFILPFTQVATDLDSTSIDFDDGVEHSELAEGRNKAIAKVSEIDNKTWHRRLL